MGVRRTEQVNMFYLYQISPVVVVIDLKPKSEACKACKNPLVSYKVLALKKINALKSFPHYNIQVFFFS